MATSRQRYKLRFFFEYGAGGCLWADNELARQDFGFGPIDKTIAQKTGKISAETLYQIERLDQIHADYLNKEYQLDPSLWKQNECDDFNQAVDNLISLLKMQLNEEFEIIDKQNRYSEDPELEEYLKDTKIFKRKK